MSDLITVADFPFMANKSFVGIGGRPITIPARFYPEFKQFKVTESAHALVTFRKGPMIEGTIRVGWRAGGRYYQITISKSQQDVALNAINIGTKLVVRVLKNPQDWLIEIN